MPNRHGLPSHQELRALQDHELATKIDVTLEGTPSDWRFMMAQMYRDELVRREQQRSADAMLAYTREMNHLTRQIRVLTVVILLATLATLAVAFLRH